VEPKEIMVAFTVGDSLALGNIWRITAKKADFYLDPLGEAGDYVHLSVHGPNETHPGHRFHIKPSRDAKKAHEQGYFVSNGLPRKGLSFAGQQLGPRTFLVARVRWTWHLQRPRFRAAAATSSAPELHDHQWGARQAAVLPPNDAWDIDLVISYEKPYWPDSRGSLRDNARLGPLSNDAGIWLTATSYHRSQMKYPSPERLCPSLPQVGEEPSRIMCGGLGPNEASDMWWFVETITSRRIIEASAAALHGIAG
jgi:hypothetical protein